MEDQAEIKAIVNESGNSFHCKVANYLKAKGLHTLVSPYYLDSATGKPREIDLIAERSWIHKGDYSGGKYGALIFKLFIECKYIPYPTVFWFSDKDIASAKEWVVSNTPLLKNNFYTEGHHYLSTTNPKVAKLFASKNKPSIENEVIYKGLNQSLNAMIYLRGREPIDQKFREQDIPILRTVEIPVILCNSFADFYRVEMENPAEPNPIGDNFQLEVNYAYFDYQKKQTTEYFLIDIVDFNKLDDFLEILEGDKNAMFHFL
ncbi:MAG: hypothetical protein LUQ65_14370 [Candidatus Helarchaeota archaeon]|nr:hypothetical protein [Candidatus Helarchaeota archaeon]